MAESLEARRLLSAGDLDMTFGGGDGVAPFSFVPQFAEATPHATVAIGDGTFVAVGTTDPLGDGNTSMAIVKYRANGALDGSFGVGGVVITDFGPGADEAHAVAVTPGGGVVVAGMTTQGAEQDVAVARYEPDGTLDHLFGDGGMARAGFAGRADIGAQLKASLRAVDEK